MDGADTDHSVFAVLPDRAGLSAAGDRQGGLASQLESRARRDGKKRPGRGEERTAGRKSHNSSPLSPTLSVSLSPNGVPRRQSLTKESPKRDPRSQDKNRQEGDWQAPLQAGENLTGKGPWVGVWKLSAYPEVQALLRGLDTQHDCIGLVVQKQKMHSHSEHPSGFSPTRKYLVPTVSEQRPSSVWAHMGT